MKIPAITYPSLLSALFISFLAPGVAQAQTIDVTFENEPAPLFGESNVLPGDSVSRSFTVKNTGTDDRTAYVRTINDADTNGLAGALLVAISEAGGVTVYDGSLADLFSRNNKSDSVPLGLIVPSASQTYDLTVTFAPGSGNDYQNGTATFDLCVGFDGGNENCINGTGGPDDDDNDNDDDDGNGGGGGGGTTLSRFSSDDDGPEGRVAGAATSSWPTFIPNWLGEAGDWLGAAVSDTVDQTPLAEASSTDGEVLGETDSFGEVTTSSAGPLAAFDMEDGRCTLIWLLLLAVLALATSAVDDLWQHRGRVFRSMFFRQLIFSLLYVIAVIAAAYFGWLSFTWFLFFGAWAVMQAVDYRAHAKHWEIWRSAPRLLTMGGGAALLALLALTIGWPCVWWPFAVITASTLLVRFVGDQ